MQVYWSRAHHWAAANAKLFEPVKALTSIVAGAIPFILGEKTLREFAGSAVYILAAYVLLHALHYLANLLFRAPAALYLESQNQISNLSAELDELRRPKLSPIEAKRLDEVKQKLGRLDTKGLQYFRALLDGEQWEYATFTKYLKDSYKFTENDLSTQFEKAKECMPVFIEVPARPPHGDIELGINPVYRKAVELFLCSRKSSTDSSPAAPAS